MKAPMLALIVPLGESPGYPSQGLPGYGHPDQGLPGYGHPDQGLPGYGHPDQGLPGQGGRPGNALPTPPVKPATPIVLPPNVWPPRLPPEVDNSLPSVPHGPISLPSDPDLGISLPIVLPPLPQGVALLIALPNAQPKGDAPANTKPAILVQAGKAPVLVYVSAAASPK